MRVAVIPARGGSKRIPRKNIRAFCGRPMISYAIDAAGESGCFERVVVSTEDDEIAGIALKLGAEVPFRRPADMADDHTSTTPIIRHAIQTLEAQGTHLEYVCCIYPAVPMLTGADLRRGWELLSASDADYAFSVTSYAYPVQRALRISAQGRVSMLQSQYRNFRSQDLEPVWHDAGQFYWGRRDAFLEARMVLGEGAIAIPIPRHRVVDIDNPEDWIQAEQLYRAAQLPDPASQENGEHADIRDDELQ